MENSLVVTITEDNAEFLLTVAGVGYKHCVKKENGKLVETLADEMPFDMIPDGLIEMIGLLDMSDI
jgi:hypothetical protein